MEHTLSLALKHESSQPNRKTSSKTRREHLDRVCVGLAQCFIDEKKAGQACIESNSGVSRHSSSDLRYRDISWQRSGIGRRLSNVIATFSIGPTTQS